MSFSFPERLGRNQEQDLREPFCFLVQCPSKTKSQIIMGGKQQTISEYIMVASSSVLKLRNFDEQLVEVVVADLIGERRDQGFGFLGRFAAQRA